jgi:hypothetical protein
LIDRLVTCFIDPSIHRLHLCTLPQQLTKIHKTHAIHATQDFERQTLSSGLSIIHHAAASNPHLKPALKPVKASPTPDHYPDLYPTANSSDVKAMTQESPKAKAKAKPS